MQDLFAMILDFDNAVAAIAAFAAFGAVVTLAAPALGGGRFEARLKSVREHRENLRRQSLKQLKSQNRGLRDTSRGFLRDVVDRLKLETLLADPKLAEKMMQAGLRGQRPVTRFYFARLTLPFVLFAGSLAYLFLVNDHGQAEVRRFAFAFALGVLGYYLPSLYLSNIAQKRRESIMRGFPDALDLLLICVEAGMSIEAAFNKVASEIGATSIELAEELSLTTAELSYLQDRRQAYENLGKRANHPGVRAVATALIQAERYGTPLGNALRVMAKENRDMRLAAAEKKAAALPAKLTVPMIIFFLPVLFVVILGPAIIRFQQVQ